MTTDERTWSERHTAARSRELDTVERAKAALSTVANLREVRMYGELAAAAIDDGNDRGWDTATVYAQLAQAHAIAALACATRDAGQRF